MDTTSSDTTPAPENPTPRKVHLSYKNARWAGRTGIKPVKKAPPRKRRRKRKKKRPKRVIKRIPLRNPDPATGLPTKHGYSCERCKYLVELMGWELTRLNHISKTPSGIWYWSDTKKALIPEDQPTLDRFLFPLASQEGP